MRIIIQDSKRQSYFDGTSWTQDIIKAKHFESTVLAERYCVEHKLEGALIVIKFLDCNAGDVKFPAGSGIAFRGFNL